MNHSEYSEHPVSYTHLQEAVAVGGFKEFNIFDMRENRMEYEANIFASQASLPDDTILEYIDVYKRQMRVHGFSASVIGPPKTRNNCQTVIRNKSAQAVYCITVNAVSYTHLSCTKLCRV